MKKLLLVLVMSLVFVSCKKETPIEKSTANYVQTNLKDPSSYEKIFNLSMRFLTFAFIN